MDEGLPFGRGIFMEENSYQAEDLRSILKKVPVSSIFPNASRRGRKANAPRKRTHPDSIDLNDSTSLQAEPEALGLAGINTLLLPDAPANKRSVRRTSERPQLHKTRAKPKARTAKERKEVSNKILSLTMEIITVLAGEECTIVTKSGEPIVPGNCPLLTGGPIPASVAQALKQERQNEEKILDLTFRIIHLLTGEVGSKEATPSSVGNNKGLHKSVIVERNPSSSSQGARLAESSMSKEAISGDADIYGSSNKEELVGHDVGMITETGTYARPVRNRKPYKTLPISESSGEDNVGESDHVALTTVRIKEEAAACEEGTIADGAQFLSVKIKEESMSDDDDVIPRDVVPCRAPRNKKKRYSSKYCTEDTDSREDDNDSNVYAPADFDQFASSHSDPSPMLFPNSSGPPDFLGFDDNSNLDTDVNALIKHAHTKFSFAPIEGGSGSEEDEPAPEPEIQSPPKDDLPPKPASNVEEANSCEEGTSEEAAVTSTKKDRTLKTYTCSECQECFVRRSDFANHRRDHRRERLTCPECGKVFANKPSLLNHLTGHTGEKPYSCPVCGKCFTRNSNLIVHQATHIERSPFTALNVRDVLVNQIL
ncbi:oocyte zinc finger protein XlCOF29-like [Hyperolius riggenbachi]|uniref:oocyte zinc finger protein XlCOF29-like n=1 Tax=Hyperolius riggenbachi TaxID=752182 RepID=UPI0035A27357